MYIVFFIIFYDNIQQPNIERKNALDKSAFYVYLEKLRVSYQFGGPSRI